jgi:hypothetical protein
MYQLELQVKRIQVRPKLKAMSNVKFNQVLSEVTNFQTIKWLHAYSGDNGFISSCKRKMKENYPLSTKQFNGLKKCYAYFLIKKPAKKLSEKQSEKIDVELDVLLNENN